LVLGADDHRPQLEQIEIAAALPDAALPIEHGPPVLELDRDCRRREERTREGQAKAGADNIRGPVQRAFSQTAGTPFRK
jgi:hypothetical protein